MKSQGLSVVELLVVLGIITLVLGFGIARVRGSAQMNAEALAPRNVKALIRATAEEAQSRRTELVIVAEASGSSTSLYVQERVTRRVADTQLKVALPSGMTIEGLGSGIEFNRLGLLGSAGEITLQGKTNSWTLKISNAGDVVIQ